MPGSRNDRGCVFSSSRPFLSSGSRHCRERCVMLTTYNMCSFAVTLPSGPAQRGRGAQGWGVSSRQGFSCQGSAPAPVLFNRQVAARSRSVPAGVWELRACHLPRRLSRRSPAEAPRGEGEREPRDRQVSPRKAQRPQAVFPHASRSWASRFRWERGSPVQSLPGGPAGSRVGRLDAPRRAHSPAPSRRLGDWPAGQRLYERWREATACEHRASSPGAFQPGSRPHRPLPRVR